MECSKWEKKGLLYYYGELEEGEQEDFRQHLEQGCSYCSAQMKNLEYEYKEFFRDDVFVDTVPERLDKRIKSKIESSVKPAVLITPFIDSFLKKSLIPVLLLAAGFGGGLMYAVNTGQSGSMVSDSVSVEESSAASGAESSLDSSETGAAGDTLEKVRFGEGNRTIDVNYSD